ncbi:MAG: phosphoribosyl-ATP diphosphatase [Bifidobacteriaceae bacterium]|nr:phosphoribosyl-ATP diphosphatase [Bifidobacteriaceae bacterium]
MLVKTIDQLYRELLERERERPAGSGTARLLEGGVHGIGKKLVEEAAEAWMAAEYETDEQVALEVSQLLYYAQLLLVARGVPLAKVYEVL